MIQYILQIMICQALFLFIYDVFLSKETFFKYNRWYLLTTPLLALIIPKLKIPSFEKVVPKKYIFTIPEFEISNKIEVETTPWYQQFSVLEIIFFVGILIFTTLFIIKLVKIYQLIKQNNAEKNQKFTLIWLQNSSHAYSFFNYIFLGNLIPTNQLERVIVHESTHCKQKHSIDLLLIEIFKILMWFNPLLYLYQQRLALVHEYIADEASAKKHNTNDYVNGLLNNLFKTENISFINQFYRVNFIKKRIQMMTKTHSKKMNQLKYLLLIPALTSLLVYFSCTNDVQIEETATLEKATTYVLSSDGTLKEFKGTKETYLDSYIGFKIPKQFTEVDISTLTELEKLEYTDRIEKTNSFLGKYPETEIKLFTLKNNRKILGVIAKIKKTVEVEEVTEESNLVFPTFPGCPEGDKDCFQQKMQEHFAHNFNANIVKGLGLQSGKKRVFISAKISKDGKIIDINIKGPHQAIEEEVKAIMQKLPSVKPGTKDGEKVNVNYALPFTLVVEK